jgi:hypothetical protein
MSALRKVAHLKRAPEIGEDQGAVLVVEARDHIKRKMA